MWAFASLSCFIGGFKAILHHHLHFIHDIATPSPFYSPLSISISSPSPFIIPFDIAASSPDCFAIFRFSSNISFHHSRFASLSQLDPLFYSIIFLQLNVPFNMKKMIRAQSSNHPTFIIQIPANQRFALGASPPNPQTPF